jgi:hypothetical protein
MIGHRAKNVNSCLGKKKGSNPELFLKMGVNITVWKSVWKMWITFGAQGKTGVAEVYGKNYAITFPAK